MPITRTALRSIAPYIAGAALCFGVGAAGAWGLRAHHIDPSSLLGSIGSAGNRPTVALGAVALGAGVAGDSVLGAARLGVDEALGAGANVARVDPVAARGARRVAGHNGHVLDANVVRVVRGPGRVLAEASVVVSSMPERAYQFSSSSIITLTGTEADTDEGVADAVRRATRSATARAVDQMNHPAR